MSFDPSRGAINVDFESIAAGTTEKVEVKLAAVAAGTHIGLVQVATDSFEADLANNRLLSQTEMSALPLQPADLSLAVVPSTTTAEVGDEVTFTLSLANAGANLASNIVVATSLPSGLTVLSVGLEQGTYDVASGNWTVGNMRDGIDRTLSILAKVGSAGDLTARAEIASADEPDPDSTPGNGTPSEDDFAAATIRVGSGPAEILGTARGEFLKGTDGDDVIRGLGGNDTVWGLKGNDLIYGDKGNDVLFGKSGQDRVYGGDGADRFVLRVHTDAPIDGLAYEEILDFSRASGDKIDLRVMDADSELAGKQKIVFIGGSAFTTSGQLRVEDFAGDFLVLGNLNSDTSAELGFVVRTGLTALNRGDFLL